MNDEGESAKRFTVAASAEDLRYAARTGNVVEAEDVLNRYKGESNEFAKFLPAVLASADSLSGNRALHLCAANGYLDLVRLLLKHNVDIDATNLSGSTALHYASLNGQLDVVQELVKRNAKPVVENKYGKTALDEARSSKSDAVAEFLLVYVEQTGNTPELEKEEKDRSHRTTEGPEAKGDMT